MTKKDYERIARAIKRAGDAWRGDATVQPAIEFVASEIAEECRAENIRFDRDRFLDACGVAVSK